MKKLMNWLVASEEGQGMVEYGLIIALVSIVVVTALALIGTNLDLKFDAINGELD